MTKCSYIDKLVRHPRWDVLRPVKTVQYVGSRPSPTSTGSLQLEGVKAEYQNRQILKNPSVGKEQCRNRFRSSLPVCCDCKVP